MISVLHGDGTSRQGASRHRRSRGILVNVKRQADKRRGAARSSETRFSRNDDGYGASNDKRGVIDACG